jgi:hypothetical protein
MAYDRKRQRKEFRLTRDQFVEFMRLPGTGGATLHETTGPLWQDIYWSPANRPYVNRTLPRDQVARRIGLTA